MAQLDALCRRRVLNGQQFPRFNPVARACINGRTVTLGTYFDQDVDGVVARLLGEQLEDGGWNCEVESGDSRIDEAIDLLRSKRQADGNWMLENTPPGKVHFALEDGDGRPSRWNTLRALRVLDWYEQSAT